jgi:hypothetical protein
MRLGKRTKTEVQRAALGGFRRGKKGRIGLGVLATVVLVGYFIAKRK